MSKANKSWISNDLFVANIATGDVVTMSLNYYKIDRTGGYTERAFTLLWICKQVALVILIYLHSKYSVCLCMASWSQYELNLPLYNKSMWKATKVIGFKHIIQTGHEHSSYWYSFSCCGVDSGVYPLFSLHK